MKNSSPTRMLRGEQEQDGAAMMRKTTVAPPLPAKCTQKLQKAIVRIAVQMVARTYRARMSSASRTRRS